MRESAADSARRIHELLMSIRPTVENVVFAPDPAPLGAVTGLLSVVPSELCDRIGELWTTHFHQASEHELREQFTREDRLLLDLIISLSDDRRAYAVPDGDSRAH